MKVCKKCKELKTLNEFHIDRNNKDGHKNICKNCRKNKKFNRRDFVRNHRNLDRSISISINRALKKNKENYIWETVTGNTLQELKNHLESFFDKEMNWENYGKKWVVTKVIPTSYYNYSDKINNEFKKAWSLKNIIPLSKKEQASKKDTIIWNLVNKYNAYDILPIGILGEIKWLKQSVQS